MDHEPDDMNQPAVPGDLDEPAEVAPRDPEGRESAGNEAAGSVAEPPSEADPSPESSQESISEPAAEDDAPAAAEDEAPAAPEAEPEPAREPEPVPEPQVEVEPELAAAVEEALEPVAAEAADDADDDDDLLAWEPGEWYVVHTYAGYENKVKADLETRVASMNMEDKIYEVVIPTEEVLEVKSGKRQKVSRKVFPGYLLVRLELDDESWYVVRNTPGVTGFVGSGSTPTPLSEKEVDRILSRGKEEEAAAGRPKPKLEWAEDDSVRVTTGPFANFQGVISEVDGEREKVKVLVNIFGRETPVELSFDDIQKV